VPSASFLGDFPHAAKHEGEAAHSAPGSYSNGSADELGNRIAKSLLILLKSSRV
jgi:hypothetical protein